MESTIGLIVGIGILVTMVAGVVMGGMGSK